MITREEYEFLKKLKTEGFVWIARDKNGKLYTYQEMPRRSSTIWNFGGVVVNIRGEYFTFIKWEDEKPTKIDDLIRDYESHQEITGGNNLNKAELVKEIEDILDDVGVSDYQLGEYEEDTIWTISSITIRKIFSAIEKHSPVSVGERVKVVIPQFVADWIEDRKNIYTLKGLFESSMMPESVESWIACDNENCEKMALAWIYGYEVEKEKLYTVDLNFNQALGKRNGVIKFYEPNDKLWVVERKLTKSEIESVNPILMQIAEEVE